MIRNRTFDIRIIFDKKGKITLDYVHAPYKVKTKWYNGKEWRDVPESLRKKIATELGGSVSQT